MKIDKLKCLIVLRILVFLLGLYFYVTTSFRSTTQDVIENQEQTTKDAQPSEADAHFVGVAIPSFSWGPEQHDIGVSHEATPDRRLFTKYSIVSICDKYAS